MLPFSPIFPPDPPSLPPSSAVSDYTSCFLPCVVRRLLLISFPSLPRSLSFSECLVLLLCRPLPLCLAFPHSIIILSLAPSVESLERPPASPLRSTAPSLTMGSEMLLVFFPLRTVEQKGVHTSLCPHCLSAVPSSSVLPSFPCPRPSRSRSTSDGKKMKNDVVSPRSLFSLSLSMVSLLPEPKTEDEKCPPWVTSKSSGAHAVSTKNRRRGRRGRRDGGY